MSATKSFQSFESKVRIDLLDFSTEILWPTDI